MSIKVTPIVEADLNAQAADAASHFATTRCAGGDAEDMSQRVNDFAHGFYAGVRFYERYHAPKLVSATVSTPAEGAT